MDQRNHFALETPPKMGQEAPPIRQPQFEAQPPPPGTHNFLEQAETHMEQNDPDAALRSLAGMGRPGTSREGVQGV